MKILRPIITAFSFFVIMIAAVFETVLRGKIVLREIGE